MRHTILNMPVGAPGEHVVPQLLYALAHRSDSQSADGALPAPPGGMRRAPPS